MECILEINKVYCTLFFRLNVYIEDVENYVETGDWLATPQPAFPGLVLTGGCVPVFASTSLRAPRFFLTTNNDQKVSLPKKGYFYIFLTFCLKVKDITFLSLSTLAVLPCLRSCSKALGIGPLHGALWPGDAELAGTRWHPAGEKTRNGRWEIWKGGVPCKNSCIWKKLEKYITHFLSIEFQWCHVPCRRGFVANCHRVVGRNETAWSAVLCAKLWRCGPKPQKRILVIYQILGLKYSEIHDPHWNLHFF